MMYDLKYSTAVQYKMTQYGTFYHSSAKGHRLKINESDFSNRNQVTAIEVFPPRNLVKVRHITRCGELVPIGTLRQVQQQVQGKDFKEETK